MVVEDHGRLVALAMHPEELPQHVELLLGEGDSVCGWSLY
jgi:hypothetical protein